MSKEREEGVKAAAEIIRLHNEWDRPVRFKLADMRAARLEGVKAGLEAAATVAQDYDGDGVSKSGQYTQLGDGSRTRADISEAIRAIDPERIAEDK